MYIIYNMLFFTHSILKSDFYFATCGKASLFFPLDSKETVDQIDDLESKSSEEEEEEEVAQEHVQADVPMAAPQHWINSYFWFP